MGGYETSASLLAFAVHFIAQHPDKEAKLLAEIDAFGRDAIPTFDDCDQVSRRWGTSAVLHVDNNKPGTGPCAASIAVPAAPDTTCDFLSVGVFWGSQCCAWPDPTVSSSPCSSPT